jgi:hypothetical protein
VAVEAVGTAAMVAEETVAAMAVGAAAADKLLLQEDRFGEEICRIVKRVACRGFRGKAETAET